MLRVFGFSGVVKVTEEQLHLKAEQLNYPVSLLFMLCLLQPVTRSIPVERNVFTVQVHGAVYDLDISCVSRTALTIFFGPFSPIRTVVTKNSNHIRINAVLPFFSANVI